MPAYILAAVIVYSLYFLMCYLGTGSEQKNLRSTNFYSYPDAIQEEIRKNNRIGELIPPPRHAMQAFWSNLFLFTVVFTIIGLLLRIPDTGTAFVYFLCLGEGLNLFDLLVIDLCWWRHSPRVRIPGIGKAEDYQDMSKHIASFLRALPMFAFAAVLAALMVSMFV